MPKPTNRRTSLQPVFEPFNLLEDAPIMPLVPTNGYHLEELDDDTNSCNGHHCDLNGASINGASINGTSAHDHLGHDDPGIEISDLMIDGAFGLSDADPDLADLAAAKAAFAAEPISEGPVPNLSPSDIANQNDTAHQNGHSGLNGHSGVLGETELNGHSESNGAMITVPADSPLESLASPVVSAAPPIVGDEPVEPAAEPFMEAPSANESAPMAATREPHPASGSLFVPYLVTEIRELRNRRQSRRSWWRRIFG
jgi:hypothetical protein